MSELLLLHHYPASPFSEKVRIALGIKGLAWRSVTIPVIMPKPDLTALTGAYRKTPVMQVGADIYCDTACIMRELERRHPSPTFYPEGSAGLADIVASWADSRIFMTAVAISFANFGDKLPQDFKDDRAKLMGREFDVPRMKAMLPYQLDQMRGQLDLIDTLLADGRSFLLGRAPSLADCSAYHPVWFCLARLGATAPFVHYGRVHAWAERMKAIGHGKPTELSSAEALEIARSSKPEGATEADAQDPNGLKPGQRVSVTPDDTGRDPVVGELIRSSVREIVIRRTDERAGTVHVHFPRLGFAVAPA